MRQRGALVGLICYTRCMKADELLIYCDMDGTMLTDWSRGPVLPKNNMRALREFTAAGGAVSLATGRQVSDALAFFAGFEFNAPLVLGNGATICDPHTGQALWNQLLEPSVTEFAMRLVERWNDVWLVGADSARLYVYRESEKKLAGLLDGVARIPLDKDEFREMQAVKVCFACASPERMPEIERCMENSGFFEGIEMVRSGNIFLEIMQKGVSKAAGVRRAVKLAGLESRRLVGFGDYLNDLEMLREADIAACPSNSAPEILSCADIVCCSNNDGAFAQLVSILTKE